MEGAKKTLIELLEHRKTTKHLDNIAFDSVVYVAGYIDDIREVSKKLSFLNLYDQYGSIQITCKEGLCDLSILDKLTKQSFVAIEGKLVKGKAKIGREIEASIILMLTDKPSIPLPIDVYDQNTNLDKRLDVRWVDLRNPKHRLPIELTSEFVLGAKEYFMHNDYTEIFSPKIVGYPMEGGAELFMLPYFTQEAYLAQSPQFYKQMALCSGFERVFEIAPVFRAEPSFTTRHTTEYTSFDAEIGYIKDHHDVMTEEERVLKHTLSRINDKYADIIKKEFGIDIEIPESIPRIKMEEAYEVVTKTNISDDGDLNPEGEKEVAKYVKETYNSPFVFVTDYPLTTRPFYHMIGEPMKSGVETTKSFDLIYNGVEITTGAQREHNYETLAINIQKKGLNKDNLQYYIDMFKYGAPTHGGYGAGVARIIKQLLNITNIRETTFVPRDPKRLFP